MIFDNFEYTQHIPLVGLNILISVVILWFAYRRRADIRGSHIFIALMALLVLRSLVIIPTFATDDEATLLFWQNIQWPINGYLVALWFTFALYYTGGEHRLTAGVIFFLVIIPTLAGILIWFDQGAFRQSYQVIVQQGMPELSAEAGIITIAHTIYVYGLAAIGVLLILMYSFASPGVYRRQAMVVSLSVAVILVAYAVQFRQSIHPALMPQVLILIVQIIIITGMLRDGFLQFHPASRQLLMVAMRDAFILLDHYDRITDVNDSALRILKQSRSDIIGKPIRNFLLRVPEVLELVQNDREETIGVVLSSALRQQYYDVSLLRIMQRGSVSRCLIWRDNTLQKQAEEARIQRLEYDAHISALAKFVDMASHDLRHPLSSLELRLYILEKSLEDEKQLSHLHKIRAQSTKIHQILEDMFLLLRLEAKHDMMISEVNLTVMFETIKTDYQPQATQNEITFTVKSSTERAFVDEDLISRALRHLLDNAFTYTPRGGTIRLSASASDDDLILRIQDNGAGIPVDQIKKVSEPFFRGEIARTTTTGGSGLGITIAKNVVLAHNGQFNITSEVGKGTTVSLTIPNSNPAEADQQRLMRV